MQRISAKIIVSLSLLLSFVAQPLLAMAMPCPMQADDMSTMIAEVHPAGHQMMAAADTSMAAMADVPMDCCDEDSGCTMSSCAVLALQYKPGVLFIEAARRVTNFYSPLYHSAEPVSLYRPPITR